MILIPSPFHLLQFWDIFDCLWVLSPGYPSSIWNSTHSTLTDLSTHSTQNNKRFFPPVLSISSGNLIVYSVPPNDNLGVILHFSFCRPHQPPGPCSFISLPPPLLPPFGFSSHLTWPDGIGIAASGIIFFSNISTHGYQSPNIQTSRLVLYKFLSKHPLKKSVPFR